MPDIDEQDQLDGRTFEILDGNDKSILGEITGNNAYLTLYVNWMSGPSHQHLKVGESTNARFNLSGESGYYTVKRVS